MTHGACLCGAVRFEVEPPYRWFAYCHCSMCRRQHGALFGAGLGVERASFKWLGGTDAIVPYRASASFERPFCRHCGSKVPAASHLPDVMLVPAGTLDGDFDVKPRAHIFVGSKSPLCTITDALPRFDAYPPGVDLPVVPGPAAGSSADGLTGSCLCGEIAYELRVEPRRIVHCHCSLCRRSRGGPFATTSFASCAHFEWTRGMDSIGTYRMQPPRSYGTDFCTSCGSLLPTVVPEADLVLIQAGALEAPLAPLPGVHIYVGSKADWDDITDALPEFDEMPPPERFAEYF